MRSLLILSLFLCQFLAFAGAQKAKIITCAGQDINFCHEKIVIAHKSYFLDLAEVSLEVRAKIFNTPEKELEVSTVEGEISKEIGYTNKPLESVEVYKAKNLDLKS